MEIVQLKEQLQLFESDYIVKISKHAVGGWFLGGVSNLKGETVFCNTLKEVEKVINNLDFMDWSIESPTGKPLDNFIESRIPF